ncbi:hypothetical protein glysoja_005328 [Glycine soja]|uniref:Uncharacterized protein n=1 Tax=Glycine max TaxID=3847 RepID=A0A0R0G2G4_SOYBN|nr:hypothetical protein glysoja_005328 [Glycine soja]
MSIVFITLFYEPVKRLTRGFFITLVAPRFDQFAVLDTWHRLRKQFSFFELLVQLISGESRTKFISTQRIWSSEKAHAYK